MHLERLRVVAALPPDGGWRADLAVDRSTTPARAVLVARVPPAVASDALALSMLARGLDLCGRIQHPALRRLLGTGEVEGDLVLVEAWHEGETLRGVLDAGGPLAPELAARVAVEVAGALQAGHSLPAALGRPLCHGAVGADRVLLAEDGRVLLCGVGRPIDHETSPHDDLLALARLLLECLPPPGPGAGGLLQAVADRAFTGTGYRSVADFAGAVAAAVKPAGVAAMMARVEASQPPGLPAWEARRHALAQALRAEDGAAADEISPPEPPAPAALGPGQAPADQAAPRVEAASAPASPEAVTRAAREAAVAERFFESAPARPTARAAPVAAPEAASLDALLRHPMTPLAVGLAMGLLGLIIGFALGGR